MNEKPTTLGATSFTLEELCRAVDLRATAISALDQMELFSRVLRFCIACAAKRGDEPLTAELIGFAKSIENSWASKRDIEAAIKDLFQRLAK